MLVTVTQTTFRDISKISRIVIVIVIVIVIIMIVVNTKISIMEIFLLPPITFTNIPKILLLAIFSMLIIVTSILINDT